jgi:hypothetical protein
MILDKGFFVSLKNEVATAVELVSDLELRGVPTRVPTILIQELYVSVGAGNEPEENARQYEALIANKPIVSLDENIARRAGTLEGIHLMSDSKPNLGAADAVVAPDGDAPDGESGERDERDRSEESVVAELVAELRNESVSDRARAALRRELGVGHADPEDVRIEHLESRMSEFAAYAEALETDDVATLCTLSVDDHHGSDGERRFMLGNEPILDGDGEVLVDEEGRRSYVTSAGTGPTVG